ncbi:MAG: DegT/DnrJ/EryC1/StrS family aminotransferase [Pirellulales bacterium]|nr:DegT/DnrJ/EryC1/StrS family aminotransferase [Pirellulales bacterium]
MSVQSVPEVTFPREFPGIHYYDRMEEEAVLRVIRNKSPFRYYGASFLQEVNQLEQEFKTRLGRKYAQAVASGTSGLAAALAALEVGPGQEVLIPCFLWVSTVGTVVRAGAIPVLVDIDDSFNMCPRDLAAKITAKSTLIIPVHMCGVPVAMPAIMDIAKKQNLRVLEDCAQANGASLDGQAVGTFGDMAVFSFQMNKMITAGEGGIVVCDREALIDRTNAAHDLGVPWSGQMPDDSKGIYLWGAGSRMSELVAAVLRAQIGKLDQIVRHLRDCKRRIKEQLADLPGITWRRVDDPDGDCGAFLIALFENSEKATRFQQHAAPSGLAATRLTDYGLHIYYNIRALVRKCSNSPDGYPWTHPMNQESPSNYVKGTLPVADNLFERSVIIPIASCLTGKQESLFVDLFRKAARV